MAFHAAHESSNCCRQSSTLGVIRSGKTGRILPSFAFVLIPYLGLKLMAALQCYPALDGDSWIFGMSALEYQRTVITLQPFTDWSNADPNFVPHGYLYQITLATLSSVLGYKGVYISNLILFVTYVTLFLALCSIAPVNRIVAFCALILSIWFVGPSTFRPELFAANLILVWILAMICVEYSGRNILKSVLSACALALLAVTQPTIALLSAAIFCYWMIYDRGSSALASIALIATLAILGTVAITELIVGSFLTWIEGVFAHGQNILAGKSLGDLPLLSVELLWIGIVPAAFLVIYAHAKKLALMENMAPKVLLTGAGVTFIVIFSFFQFVYFPRSLDEAFNGPHYFIQLFVPICIVLLWRMVNEMNPYARATIILLLFFPIVGAGIQVAKDGLVTAIDLIRTDSVSFIEVQPKINSLIGRETVAVDALFVPAIEGDAKKLLVGIFKTTPFLEGEVSDIWGQERAKDACVIIIKQSNTSLERPPNIPNFIMTESTFSSPLRLFGHTFYRTPKGYNYAVYHRLTCY